MSNQFCGLMDKMEQDQNEEEKTLFKEWRHNFELKLRQHIEKFEEHKKFESIAGSRPTILKRGTEMRGSKPKRKAIHFSEILLIREIIIENIEPGEIVQLGQQQKFVLEKLKVELLRDFCVRMTPRGRIVPKSTRQILTPETQRFTNRHEISGKSTRKAKKTALGRASEGYATIEGGEEGDKVPTVPSPKTVQLRPRLPTTPIPRSLPASLLASPSTPQQDIMPTAATLLSAPAHLEQPATSTEPLAMLPSGCWCPLGTECQALKASTSAHYSLLCRDGKVLAKAGESTDGYDEAADVMPETKV
uniref:Uncharacterized protein n=1 Tax=Globodera rostochiensis TaxID=31243 RepID=A0A914GYU4_GLORO